MLNFKKSDVLTISRDLEVLGGKSRSASHSFGRSQRFTVPSRPWSLDPGCYGADCEFVSDPRCNLRGQILTRSRTSPNFSFAREDRRDMGDRGGGFLKGMAPTFRSGRPRDINPLGPGTYDPPKPGGFPYKAASPAYTCPRARSSR
eukprot:TRINITY_DN15991_c0_g1_i1.p1 TRINITY_DN15991_c0_g1~~TRINITY_DN15991_c0_g1_i1.p1  ORF type:complete len:146 (-),score=5.54 TRINITY_DN15991_c0_g1_i1:153-590(-)